MYLNICIWLHVRGQVRISLRSSKITAPVDHHHSPHHPRHSLSFQIVGVFYLGNEALINELLSPGALNSS